jgi:hypothetical protein
MFPYDATDSIGQSPMRGGLLMNASPTGWRVAVFRRCSETDLSHLILDLNMIKVLRQLDGHKSLASVAFAAGLTMTELQNAIKSLVDLGLIEPISLDRGSRRVGGFCSS